jgi:hypothetical protein
MALFQWPYHGRGILNWREAYYEKKINPKVVAKLKSKWQFVIGHNVTATPSVSLDGILYFSKSMVICMQFVQQQDMVYGRI